MSSKKSKRSLALLFCLIMVISVTACSGGGQKNGDVAKEDGYPSQNFELAIPFSAGGAADVAARTLVPHLAEQLGVNVLPENREGAGTQIGLTFLLDSPAADDGYVALFATQPHTSNTIIGQGANYKLEDIHWLNFHMIDPLAVNVAPDAQWNDFAEMVDYIKENPGKVSFGVPQMGGPHIFLEYLKEKFDLDLIIVPYDGGGDARAALIGGHVDAAFTNTQSSVGIKDQSKSLGVGWSERHELWPDTPCFAELFDDEEIVDTIMGLASFRGVAVSTKFKEAYPERYEILLEAYDKAFHSKGHMEDMEKNGQRPVCQWIGPEESNKLAKMTHETLLDFAHLF